MDANHRHPSKEEVRAWMARRRVSSRARLPLLLGELAALTALITCYWLLSQLPRERTQPIA